MKKWKKETREEVKNEEMKKRRDGVRNEKMKKETREEVKNKKMKKRNKSGSKKWRNEKKKQERK